LKVIVEVETEKEESVKVYLEEILRKIAGNKHFSIISYEIKTVEDK